SSKIAELKSPAGDAEASAAVREILRGIDLKKSKVVVNINCPHTSIKKITTPYMPKNELREGILLDAKSYFTFSIDEAIVDFEITGDVIEKGVRKYEVSVAVCPIETSKKYVNILEKAGVKPAAFISTPYGLEKIAKLSIAADAKPVSYIDIGKTYTELIIMKGSALVFSRKIPVSGDDFTKSLTSMLVTDKGKVQLSLEEAEAIKREIGIPKEDDTRLAGGKIPAYHILSMIRSPLELLTAEIGRCFDYYREEGGSGNIESIILSGGGASLSGLVAYLAGDLGLNVHLSDPVSGLKGNKSALTEAGKMAHRYTPAIGAVSIVLPGINLLPVEVKDATTRVIKRGTIEVAITAVIIISILLYTGMKIRITNLETRIATAKFELSGLAPQLGKAEAQALAGSVLMDEPQWEDIFVELSNLIPDTIHLTKMSMQNNILTIKGIVAASDGEQILADFVLTLEKGIFHDVKLVESKDLIGKTGVEFELKCWVDYE
ncbi:MAG: pilus assembly protein PilM, partial [Candidatus Omnitrophota bacterium]